MNKSSLETASLSSQEHHFWLPKQASTDFYLHETTKLESQCQIQQNNNVMRKHARYCPQGGKFQSHCFILVTLITFPFFFLKFQVLYRGP